MFTDRLFQDVDFDVARLFGELSGGNPFAAERVQRVQQTHREAARAAEAGGRRQIRHRADVNGRLDFQQSQTLPRDVVLDLIDGLDLLALGIIEPDRFIEHAAVAFDGHVNVLIDRRAQHHAGLALVKIREIRAAAGKAHPERRARHDETGVCGAALSHASRPSYKEYRN